MRITLVLALCIAAVVAYPQQNPRDVQTVSENNANDGSGNFANSYALSDGTNREEKGEFTPIDADTGIQRISGVISWTAPNGEIINLRYIADENGFQPQGDHLPK